MTIKEVLEIDFMDKNVIIIGCPASGKTWLSNKIKSVKEIQVGITLIERDLNVVKVSFRSKDAVKYDVSKLAVLLGGGGHKMAAGATLEMPLPEAIEKVLKTCEICF